MRSKSILIFILALAFFLRFFQVESVPPSLNWDEVSIAYNAYSIYKTGRDEWGEFLPIHFRAFGEYKLPAQIYASIPGIAIFGLNELGVRITPTIYGTLTVLFLYLLALELFRDQKVALFSAFLLAISPWHLQLTRGSFESSFATFWVALAILFLVKGFKNSKWWIFSSLFFAISIYTYNSARVFAPLFLIAVLFFYRKLILKHRRSLVVSVALFLILMIPVIQFIFRGEGNSRYKLVSITDDVGLIARVNENRGNSNLPAPFSSLVHNKISYTLFYAGRNYLSHFTPEFLFLSGAPHKQHHVQGMGELYLFQAPLLLAGLYFLISKNSQFKGLLFLWIILAHIPVALTQDSIPHALRTLLVNPAYQLISGLGGVFLFNLIKKIKKYYQALVLLIAALIIIISLGVYVINYHTIYPNLYSRDWQYGYKQAVDYLKIHQNEYDLVVFTRHYGEPHIFTLFFEEFDPKIYQTDPSLVRFETYDWVRVLKFQKFYFPDLGDKGTKFLDMTAENPQKKILFIGRKEDFPDDYPRLKRINFLNGEIVFDIVEKK